MNLELIKNISEASQLGLEEVERLLGPTKDINHGDLSFPCFSLAKKFQKNPKECAEELAKKIILPKSFAKLEVVNAYINFFLDRAELAKSCIEAAQAKSILKQDRNPKTLVLDYSSPNIAKPFHVGHFRTTAIGHALVQIHRRLGNKVISINHLGDWGTQFGFVFAGVSIWGKPINPEIDDLVDLYQKASKLRKDQEANTVSSEDLDKPEVNSMAREYFIRLEAGEKTAVEFWQWCLDISLKYLKLVYQRLAVNFDYYTGESFYSDKLDNVKEILNTSGILETSRDAVGVDLGKTLGFARIYTEDGRSLYLTRDIATVFYRETTFSPDQIIYVVGAPQTLHFQQLTGVLEKLNHPAKDKIKHVAYGHVPGISTRSGSAEKFSFSALMDEAHERALHAYRTAVEKRPVEVDEHSVAEAVGIGALFFNYLMRSNIKDFHFSWDDALSFQGDTGPYLQYALARLYSISRNATANGINPDCSDYQLLTDDHSYQLVRQLAKFNEAINKAAIESEPYHVCFYALELAKLVSGSYKDLRVIGAETAEQSSARLALFQSCQYVLEECLKLIGVPILERM